MTLKAKDINREYDRIPWSASTIARAVLRVLYIFMNNVYGISTYIIWTLVILKPLFWFEKTKSLYWFLEGYCFKFLLIQVGDWLYTAGYTLSEIGDDITPCLKDRCLVLCNHQSTGDVPVLMYALSNKGECPNRIMWIMDVMFKYSNFGIVSQIHGDFFIQQGKATRDLQITRLHDHIRNIYNPGDMSWIILFPEGGFLYKRRETSQRYGEKHGLPILEHVTLPRIGAMKCVVDALAEDNRNNSHIANGNAAGRSTESRTLKWVVDVTIGYPQGQPLDVYCVSFGHRKPCETQILYRIYPIDEIPKDQDEMLQWTYNRFIEKEHLLDEFYATGSFPTLTNSYGFVRKTKQQVYISRPLIFFLHGFGILTFYVTYCIIMFVLNGVFSLLGW